MRRRAYTLRIILFAVAGIALLFALITAYSFYRKIYAPSVQLSGSADYFFIRTGSGYERVVSDLLKKEIISDSARFDWVARNMNLPNHVYAGRYKLENGMSNYALVSLLRSGRQEPVNLVITKFRVKKDAAGFISRRLEADSAQLIRALNDPDYAARFSMNTEEVMCLFIPNTYQFYWNTDADKLFARMKKEYDRFWNDERRSSAAVLKLSPQEVMILASIVEEETNYNPEKSRIAGVYLNRLRKGMLLQADPTVRFALNDFTLKRILNRHLEYDSPYNTYLHGGLPPGPICTPSITSIDAVLQAERNEYYYFCADPDKPGTHVFAKDYRQHAVNAKRYQQWLSRQSQ